MPSRPDIQAYDDFEDIAPGLRCLTGVFDPLPFKRRMTVMDTAAGQVLHSVIRMQEADMEALESRGPIAGLLLPNSFHKADIAWYAERYPDAPVWCSPEILARAKTWVPRAQVVQLSGEVEACPVEGTRIGETAFLHHPSRTLVLTDLAFNYHPGEFPDLGRRMMEWNQATRGFGMTRIFRWFAMKNRTQLTASVRRLMAWDFDRVIVNHGHIVEFDGHHLLEEAFGV